MVENSTFDSFMREKMLTMTLLTLKIVHILNYLCVLSFQVIQVPLIFLSETTFFLNKLHRSPLGKKFYELTPDATFPETISSLTNRLIIH